MGQIFVGIDVSAACLTWRHSRSVVAPRRLASDPFCSARIGSRLYRGRGVLPATARTLRGLASQIATAETVLAAMPRQNAVT